MTNTLQDVDVLILDKLAKIDRGDVVVFKQNENEDYIKRKCRECIKTSFFTNNMVKKEFLFYVYLQSTTFVSAKAGF